MKSKVGSGRIPLTQGAAVGKGVKVKSMTAAARAIRAIAVTTEAFVPSLCGRPLMPLTRSSSISFTTLRKCAAVPSKAPPSHIHSSGACSLDSAIHEGRAPNAIAYGSQEKIVNLK